MIEHIEMFEACVPDGVEPENQDGEVQRFECIARSVLVDRLAGGDFTVEAALVLGHWLQRSKPGLHPGYEDP